jgi:hypothetical protein
MTKALNCTVVISEEVCKNAGIATRAYANRRVDPRSQSTESVRTAADATLLTSLFGEQARSLTAEEMSAKIMV